MSSLDLWPIGNCQVSALVDNAAGLVWACQPRVDGDPLFCALLEPKPPVSGEWRIALENQVSAVPRYLKNTPILVTRLTDADGGIADVYDFCPRLERRGRMYRPVAFIRIVRPLAGAPRIAVKVAPASAWGAREAACTSGTNHIRFLTEPQPLRLTTDAPIIHLLEGRSFRLEESLHFFLGPDEPFVGHVGHTLATMLHETAEHWQAWVRGLAIPLEWQQVVIRAAITLKLCQHEETGAIVAALTTSIPEAPNSGRDWDYRYCWIRDAYYTVQALNRLGALDVLESYLGYLRNVVDNARSGHIQPLYAVSGEPKLEERIADDLTGYRGMGPVRVGNAAYTQIQYDAYGQIILSNTHAFFDERLFRKATAEDFASLEKVGERAWKKYDKPDAGLWEFRTRAGVHTYSAVMSWAACDRLANIAITLGKGARARILAAPRRGHPRQDREARLVSGRKEVRGDLRWRRARRQPAPARRHALPRARRPALPRHLQRGRKGSEARRQHAALCQRGRFRPARDRVQLLHLLADRGAVSGRAAGGGARTLRQDVESINSRRAAFRGRGLRNRRALGQLSADLFACRVDQLRGAFVPTVEFGPVSRLIVISNRVSSPKPRSVEGTQGGLAVALAAALGNRAAVVRLVGGQDRRLHRQDQSPPRGRSHHRDDRPRRAGRRRIL